MATRKKGPPPVPHTLLIGPGVALLVAIVLAVMGMPGFAAGVLLGAIGLWLTLVGRHKRWKGAPEAGYVLIGTGALIIILALFS
jgi:hypothetical protein